jgi:hypothetical protein
MRSDSNFDGFADSFTVEKGAETRVEVDDQAAALADPKLGVLARHHRPLVLRKEVMADRRVATQDNDVSGKRTFTEQLTAAILCQNYFHSTLSLSGIVSECQYFSVVENVSVFKSKARLSNGSAGALARTSLRSTLKY